MRRDDWLLNQLPMGMIEDEFFAHFVGIFQEVATTLLDGVDNLENVVDVTVAPDPVVRWMGSWLAVGAIDSSLTDLLQRRIVRECAKILAWRGTKRGMVALLELMSLGPATVEDSGGVYAEDAAPRRFFTVEARGDIVEHRTVPFVRLWVDPVDRWKAPHPVRGAHRRRLRRRALRRRGVLPSRAATIGWVPEEDFVTLVRNELPANVVFELSVGDRLVWPRTPVAADVVDLVDLVDPTEPVEPVRPLAELAPVPAQGVPV